jgi:hypothetical protein
VARQRRESETDFNNILEAILFLAPPDTPSFVTYDVTFPVERGNRAKLGDPGHQEKKGRTNAGLPEVIGLSANDKSSSNSRPNQSDCRAPAGVFNHQTGIRSLDDFHLIGGWTAPPRPVVPSSLLENSTLS